MRACSELNSDIRAEDDDASEDIGLLRRDAEKHRRRAIALITKLYNAYGSK